MIHKIHIEFSNTDSGYEIIELGDERNDSRVMQFVEHKPEIVGDTWFYDIITEDGAVERIFHPSRAFYAPEDMHKGKIVTRETFKEALKQLYLDYEGEEFLKIDNWIKEHGY